MKQLLWLCIIATTHISCTANKKGRVINEQIPEIAGTWLQDGNKENPCFIVQNDRDLVFLSGKQTSAGYFKNSVEVFAKDWNRNAFLSADYQTLRWADRKWIKITFTYPDVSGIWYEDSDANKQISITQNETKLTLFNGAQTHKAYFYTTNGIYSLENNNYGTYSPKDTTINWGVKKWTRKVRS